MYPRTSQGFLQNVQMHREQIIPLEPPKTPYKVKLFDPNIESLSAREIIDFHDSLAKSRSRFACFHVTSKIKSNCKKEEAWVQPGSFSAPAIKNDCGYKKKKKKEKR